MTLRTKIYETMRTLVGKCSSLEGKLGYLFKDRWKYDICYVVTRLFGIKVYLKWDLRDKIPKCVYQTNCLLFDRSNTRWHVCCSRLYHFYRLAKWSNVISLSQWIQLVSSEKDKHTTVVWIQQPWMLEYFLESMQHNEEHIRLKIVKYRKIWTYCFIGKGNLSIQCQFWITLSKLLSALWYWTTFIAILIP